MGELMYWMKHVNIPTTYIEKFVEKFKYWSWTDIKEDVSDISELQIEGVCIIYYFFKDDLKAEYMYYGVKDIIHGRLNSKIIDVLLGIYYESRGRNDYYDENGNGKFTTFLKDTGIDSYSMIEELNEQVKLGIYKLIKLGMN
eukprot:52743_1